MAVDPNHRRVSALTHVGEVRPVHDPVLDLLNDHINLVVVLQFLVVHALVPTTISTPMIPCIQPVLLIMTTDLGNQGQRRSVIR